MSSNSALRNGDCLSEVKDVLARYGSQYTLTEETPTRWVITEGARSLPISQERIASMVDELLTRKGLSFFQERVREWPIEEVGVSVDILYETFAPTFAPSMPEPVFSCESIPSGEKFAEWERGCRESLGNFNIRTEYPVSRLYHFGRNIDGRKTREYVRVEDYQAFFDLPRNPEVKSLIEKVATELGIKISFQSSGEGPSVDESMVLVERPRQSE